MTNRPTPQHLLPFSTSHPSFPTTSATGLHPRIIPIPHTSLLLLQTTMTLPFLHQTAHQLGISHAPANLPVTVFLLLFSHAPMNSPLHFSRAPLNQHPTAFLPLFSRAPLNQHPTTSILLFSHAPLNQHQTAFLLRFSHAPMHQHPTLSLPLFGHAPLDQHPTASLQLFSHAPLNQNHLLDASLPPCTHAPLANPILGTSPSWMTIPKGRRLPRTGMAPSDLFPPYRT